MVIVLEHGIKDKDKNAVKAYLEQKGFKIKEIVGEEETILGAVGIVVIDKREVELVWNGKTGEVCNIVLPFQVI